MTVHTDFYTDPMCIWALLAEPKVDELERTFGERLVVSDRVVPLFGSVDQRFAEGAWAKGGVAARVKATARVAASGGVQGVSGACWEHRPASSWGPSAVVAAVRELEERGEIAAGSTRKALRGLRSAFFVQDRNICLRSEQGDVLESLELPREAVFERVDNGHALARLSEAVDARTELRLDGSPTWLFDGGRSKLFGNVGMAVLRATVQALLDGDEAGCSTC